MHIFLLRVVSRYMIVMKEHMHVLEENANLKTRYWRCKDLKNSLNQLQVYQDILQLVCIIGWSRCSWEVELKTGSRAEMEPIEDYLETKKLEIYFGEEKSH